MAALAQEGRTSSRLRQFAGQMFLQQGIAPKDYYGEMNALFSYVRDQIRYMRDPDDVENIAWPSATIEMGFGDCDDKSILLASLLLAAGHRARFVAAAYDGPGQFEHVYVEASCNDGKSWLGLDPTEPFAPGVVHGGVCDVLIQEC
jgi:transglutaminase-like putative cysteine protease